MYVLQMAWVATEYVLEQPAIQILHRMPIQTYKSFLVELAVGDMVTLHLQGFAASCMLIHVLHWPNQVHYCVSCHTSQCKLVKSW